MSLSECQSEQNIISIDLSMYIAMEPAELTTFHGKQFIIM